MICWSIVEYFDEQHVSRHSLHLDCNWHCREAKMTQRKTLQEIGAITLFQEAKNRTNSPTNGLRNTSHSNLPDIPSIWVVAMKRIDARCMNLSGQYKSNSLLLNCVLMTSNFAPRPCWVNCTNNYRSFFFYKLVCYS
jgi:hypothetical protein